LGGLPTSLFFHQALVLLQLGVFDSKSREVFGPAQLVLWEIETKERLLPKLGNEFPADSPVKNGVEDERVR
jgi:hypothetical protein